MKYLTLILLCIVCSNPLSAQNPKPQESELLSDSVIKVKAIGKWLHEPVYLRASYPGFIIDLSGNLADSFIKGSIITFTRQYNIVKTRKGKRLKSGNYYYFRTDLPKDLSYKLAEYLVDHRAEILNQLIGDSTVTTGRSCHKHSYEFKLDSSIYRGSHECIAKYNQMTRTVETSDAAYKYLDSILGFESRLNQLHSTVPAGIPYSHDGSMMTQPLTEKQMRKKGNCNFPRKLVGED